MKQLTVLLCLFMTVFSTTGYSHDIKGTPSAHNEYRNQDDQKMLKAIIFDIGNVFVKVDLNLWTFAFKKIGVDLPTDLLQDKKLRELIHYYSEGKISTEYFISEFSNKLGIQPIPVEKFKFAWNYVILSLNLDAIKAIENFRSEGYKIYALSDNNDMHTAYIDTLYHKVYPNKSFFALFDKVYLSQQIGYRKNSDNAWLYVLKDQHLKPEECLFVDDVLTNINKAKKLGFIVFHYDVNSDMDSVLKKANDIRNHYH